ncbi:hypothetical protein HII31_07343 [Pseudocercospora fuligena]|uniref:Uncharacterized protein n=1 Tax=Pseudocercospora fuligena TaxID=685502 RepID=A0A8H6VH49_9PEZI|nr:hypothetical protein HII31_07343 [Pseudocercospora fuligena]
MVAVNQTITIVNKGGKIVSTSKHLVNVFNEAKSAYNERKAEIKAQRKSDLEAKERERKARKQLEALTLVDDEDGSASQRGSRRGSDDGRSVRRKPVPSRRSQRPPVERGVSDSFYTNDRTASKRHDSLQPSPLRHASLGDNEPQIKELTRRNTDGMQLQNKSSSRRRVSLDDIDMDLAYGELPPPLPESRVEDEIELRTKMTYLQRLLDEGNCVQHSVTAMIDNLQKNPDALAAVALTLGEIANLAAKMAPGALATMKTSFPAIIALLASPQFAIAAGVGVGVTIIAFGGYKIIKKIKAKNSEERLLMNTVEAQPANAAEDVDELRELDSIEKWRRGIADEAANSMGTSVDGEFITPVATRTLIEEGKLTEADFKPLEGKPKKSKSRKAKSDVSSSTRRSRGEKVKVKAKKEPSILRSLFKGHS